MRLRVLLVLGAGFALACGGGRGAADTGDDGRGGLFGGGGGDDTSDTWSSGSDTDPGGGNGGITRHCPKYSGLMDSGAEWRWSYTAEYEAETGQAYDWTTWVHSVDDLGGGVTRVRLKTEGELDHESYELYESSTTTTYECDDDGAWLVATQSTIRYRISGQSTQTIEQTVDYVEPLLTMIWDVEDGSSWDASYAYEATSNGQTSEYSDSVTYAASEHDDVTVPAGTFKGVLKIQAQGQEYYWVADKDAGSVWSGDHAELLSWSK